MTKEEIEGLVTETKANLSAAIEARDTAEGVREFLSDKSSPDARIPPGPKGPGLLRAA